jgi:ligand-binding sensor domain-containing protein
MSDDATFAPGVQGLAPAREGGVWIILGDNSLRWFDGARFRHAVAAPAMMSERDDVGVVVEAADRSLFATTAQGGVFRWDGSSWSQIDDARAATGAGALAVADDGTMWVGNDNVGGISRYDGVTWTAYSGKDATVLAGQVLTIVPLADGTVLVGTESGVALFDGARWTGWTSAEIGLRGNISVTVGTDGTVWAAGGSEANGAVGVASFDGDGWSLYGPEHGLPGETRLTIAVPVATEDGVFVATGAGVYQLGGEQWTQVLPVEEQATRADPPASLAGVRDVRATGGFLWAWGENEIWRYRNGAWEFYASTSEAPWDIAYDGATLWAISEGLVYLDGGEWHKPSRSPGLPWRIDADPDTGILWVSTGDELYRLDGEELVNARQPDGDDSGYSYVGDIVVTKDGRVWAAGFYGYVPSLGSVAVYDDESGLWETVPLGRDGELMPAAALAITPDGGVWVMLSDWPEDWVEATAPPPGWALAYRDPTTGDWTVYDEDLPEAHPLAMAATNDGVWLAQGAALAEGTQPMEGLFHFDGATWTHHPSSEVRSLAAAPDGTVWFVTETGVLDQIEP